MHHIIQSGCYGKGTASREICKCGYTTEEYHKENNILHIHHALAFSGKFSLSLFNLCIPMCGVCIYKVSEDFIIEIHNIIFVTIDQRQTPWVKIYLCSLLESQSHH